MNAAKRTPSKSSIRRESGVQPVVHVRSQAACVRTLLDELERGLAPELEDPMGAQIVEELGRLGCRCVELAMLLRSITEEQDRARCA